MTQRRGCTIAKINWRRAWELNMPRKFHHQIISRTWCVLRAPNLPSITAPFTSYLPKVANIVFPLFLDAQDIDEQPCHIFSESLRRPPCLRSCHSTQHSRQNSVLYLFQRHIIVHRWKRWHQLCSFHTIVGSLNLWCLKLQRAFEACFIQPWLVLQNVGRFPLFSEGNLDFTLTETVAYRSTLETLPITLEQAKPSIKLHIRSLQHVLCTLDLLSAHRSVVSSSVIIRRLLGLTQYIFP